MVENEFANVMQALSNLKLTKMQLSMESQKIMLKIKVLSQIVQEETQKLSVYQEMLSSYNNPEQQTTTTSEPGQTVIEKTTTPPAV